MEFLKRVFHFFKIYPAIFYSLFLVLFLPLFFYFHTFYITSRLQKNIDYILQTKVSFLANNISFFSQDYLENPSLLQQNLERILEKNPEIKKLRILKREGEEFKILASQNPQEIGAILEKDVGLSLAWSQDQEILSPFSESGERFWRAVVPLKGKQNEKLGLISLALSCKETDEIVARSVFFSFLLAVLGSFLSLFLVFQHTNLFGYVELSKKLQEIDKAKDEFIRMATHELQSPIVNIRNYILEVKANLEGKLNEEEKKALERVEISAKNLAELVQDILQVSRIEQGRLDFTPEALEPQKELEQLVADFELKAKAKNLKLIFEPKAKPTEIKVNRFRFREIISNLLENAIKYTPSGQVEVKTEVDAAKKRYYIFVIDTGVGISAEAQKRLFQKFFREKKRETASIPGTGLGLWLSKEMAKRMGGDILVESIEGKGSKFTVWFPLK